MTPQEERALQRKYPGLLTTKQLKKAQADYAALKPFIFCKGPYQVQRKRIKPEHQAELDRLTELSRLHNAAREAKRLDDEDAYLATLGLKRGMRVSHVANAWSKEPEVWTGTIVGAWLPTYYRDGTVMSGKVSVRYTEGSCLRLHPDGYTYTHHAPDWAKELTILDA